MPIELSDTLGPDEIEPLTALFAGEWWTAHRTAEDWRRAIAGSDLLVAAREQPGGRLVGFARVLTDGAAKALLLDVAVASSLRGHGLGRRLVEDLLDRLDRAGVRDVELYCLPELEPFYAELGFGGEVDGVRLLRRRRG